MMEITQIINRSLRFTAYAYMIYALIQFADVVNHSYSEQSEKILSAQIALNKTCDDISLLSWPAILDNCIHYRKISQRNVYWETIVEVSHQLHPCSVSKNYHDEHSSLGGHVHSDEGNESNCSYIYILGLGIAVGVILILGVFNKPNTLNEKVKND